MRRHLRTPAKTPAELYWEGTDRSMKFARAFCLDISESGIRLHVYGEVPGPGVSLHVRLEECGFSEYGVVRHAHPRGATGVQFRFDGASREHLDCWKSVVKRAQERA